MESFSSKVKAELLENIPKSRHCQAAELAALLAVDSVIFNKDNDGQIGFHCENDRSFQIIFTLLQKSLNICDVVEIENHIEDVISFTKLSIKDQCPDGVVIHQTCCKRAFIRGAFIASGSISDPDKSYHFEVVCDSERMAMLLMHAMEAFDLEPKVAQRKNKFVVYLKDGEKLVEVLLVMEATKSVMDIENIRIVKEVRNTLNRQVNCEAANIKKTAEAAAEQESDIRIIDRLRGLDSLPANLREVAQLRLEYPEASLKQLGEMMDPPLGKSGVNHRLKKLSEIAQSIK